MNGHRYTKEELDFLKDYSPFYSREELTAMFNKHFGTSLTKSGIETKCKRCGYPNNIEHYTDEQIEFLKENCRLYSRKELTEKFNEKFGTSKTMLALRQFCNKYGFNSSNNGRFKKGNITWSTGLSKEEHRSHFSDESYTSMVGILEQRNIYEVGDIRQRKIGGVYIPYVVISTDYSIPDRERIVPLTRYNWEKVYGPVPEGYSLLHLDGDVQNCDISNLVMVSDAERGCVVGNGWQGKGELTKTGVAYAKLAMAIKDKKENKNE